MRAHGVAIDNVLKIHCEDPAVDGYSVSFEHSNFQIPLQLKCVFSCVHTKEPAEKEIYECENIFLTLDSSD